MKEYIWYDCNRDELIVVGSGTNILARYALYLAKRRGEEPGFIPVGEL